MMDDLLNTLVEVRIKKDENFLKIKETLTRVGVASRKNKTLYQSCHIFHKQGKYYIVHFKEMFLVDGKESNYTDEDIGRRNKIITLLEDWDLIEVVDPNKIQEPLASISQIKIISHKEKNDWNLESKYNMGRKKDY